MSDKNSTAGADSSPPAGASDAAADKVSDAIPETPDAPGLPDLEAHAEAPAWLSGGEDHDALIWSGAFEAETEAPAEADADAEGPDDAEPAAAAAPEASEAPDDAEPAAAAAPEAAEAPDDAEPAAAAEAAPDAGETVLPPEPEVTDPDKLTLETPRLATPEVGSDAAEAASLDDTTAEVKAVEAEAAEAAVLSDPAANRPTANRPAADRPATVDHTSGIAAAAPMTNDQPDPEATESADEAAAADASGSTAAGAPDPNSRRARRTAETPAAGNGRNKRLLLIIGGLGVLVILVVLLFTVLGNSEKDPGVLEEDVAPIELESGACLSDFTGVNEPTTVVTCETAHNAQLVATATYPEDDEFPGAEALSERANEVCSGVRYTEAATERADLGLQVSKAVPTPESWNDGDRRVDCFVVVGEGQELTESLIEQ